MWQLGALLFYKRTSCFKTVAEFEKSCFCKTKNFAHIPTCSFYTRIFKAGMLSILLTFLSDFFNLGQNGVENGQHHGRGGGV